MTIQRAGFNVLADVVLTRPQMLTPEQQADVRDNIGAVGFDGFGVVTPEAYGAQAGWFLDPATRGVFDLFAPATATCREAHLRLLEHTVRRLKWAYCWAQTTVSVASTGFVTFTSAVGMSAVRKEAFDWIVGEYADQAIGLLSLGDAVTAADLDADASINVGTNTTAMQAWLAALEGGNLRGRVGPGTYIVNNVLRARDRVTFEGVKGATRFKMASTVARGVPLFQTGDVGQAAENICVSGVIFDANSMERPTGTGGANSTPRGSAVCISYTRGGVFVDGESWDAEKHGFDVTGSTYTRSGTANVFGARVERSAHVRVIRWRSEGVGDDLITCHNCDDVHFIDCDANLTRGTYSVGNSVGFELDDASRNCWVYNGRVKFAYFGAQIKAHDDSTGAYMCGVDGLDVWKCDNGVRTRHPDISALDPNSRQVFIDNITVRHPILWSSAGNGTALSPPGRALDLMGLYDSIEVGTVRVLQEGAASNYYDTDPSLSHGAIVLRSGVSNVRLDNLYVEGFPTSLAAVRVTSDVTGQVVINRLVTRNGPLRGIRSTSSSAHVLLIGYSLHRTTATTGSVGVWIDNGAVGTGVAQNYETAVS